MVFASTFPSDDFSAKHRAAEKCTPKAKPILRWAGSKRLMLPKLLDLAPRNYERYIEPFCGSACYYLALNPPKAILADLNPHLIATYEQVKLHPIEVANEMRRWKPSKREYLKVRATPANDPVTAAARFLYLNRYSFNGVYRENRQGQFNVPFAASRNGRLPTSTDLQTFAAALKETKLVCSDFERVVRDAGKGDFLYLDPPYHYGSARNRGEYGYGAFSTSDLCRFLDLVTKASDRGAQILISYNRAHHLRQSLRGWKLAYCTTRRSVAGFAQARHTVREYLLRNY